MGGPLPLALALLAVMALVALTHWLGFTGAGRLAGPDEAASLAQSLPGGFTPSRITLAREGAGALLRDRQGRVAVIAPVGAHFLVRSQGPSWQVKRTTDVHLDLRGADFAAILDLGPETDHWFTVLAGSSGADA